jgi:hypothetical protein
MGGSPAFQLSPIPRVFRLSTELRAHFTTPPQAGRIVTADEAEDEYGLGGWIGSQQCE